MFSARLINHNDTSMLNICDAELLGRTLSKGDFTRLLKIYVSDYINCITCQSPDTRIEKEKRIHFLICEACGAKSTIKGKYA